MTISFDFVIEDPRWVEDHIAALAQKTGQVICETLQIPNGCAVAVLACDDMRIAELNTAFRDKATATNVLSWPSENLQSAVPGGQPDAPTDPELGDIAISFDTCQAETVQENRPFDNHVTHLLIHGVLHLLGYDHINDPDAAVMERLETDMLAKMGIPDPYGSDIENT